MNGVKLQSMMLNKSRLGLSNQSIKWIALISMMIDHLNKILLNEVLLSLLIPMVQEGALSINTFQLIYQISQGVLIQIGMISFPLFCFLLVEGVKHTRSIVKYGLSLFLFACLSEIPFDLALFHNPLEWACQNIYFTLTLGVLMLWGMREIQLKIKRPIWFITVIQWGWVGLIAILNQGIQADYSSYGILLMAIFYTFRNYPLYQLIALVGLNQLFLRPMGWLIIVIIFLILGQYNGKRGRVSHKYAFYWAYPIHLMILYLMTIGLRLLMI